jgi:LCP family protein required for cell wall assembly
MGNLDRMGRPSRTRFCALLLAVALMVSACGSTDPGPRARLVALPKPEPIVAPMHPDAVVGEVVDVRVVDTSGANSGLYQPGSARDHPPAVDQQAVDQVVAATVSWLDARLSQVQDVAFETAMESADVASAELLTLAQLRTGDAPDPFRSARESVITDARYTLHLGSRNAPEFIRASVNVEWLNAEPSSADFMFVPRNQGAEVELVTVLPEDSDLATGLRRASVGDGDVLTILLLGSDEGPWRRGDTLRGRADGFQLLFVAGDRQHATFVSIPRDAYVRVPGRGNSRIKACLVNGPERCVETVESVFGVKVDAYLVTSMRGFSRAVTRLGGVEVDAPQAIDLDGNRIPAGLSRLDGNQALAYARARKGRPGGDFARSQSQAELLALIHAEVVADPSPARLFEVLAIARRHTITNLSGAELTSLAFEALRLPPENVQRVLAPGSAPMMGGASVGRLHDRAYQIIRDAAADGRVG